MLIRQFRILLGVNSHGNTIEEVKRLAPWQRSKFERQATLFSKQQLVEIYSKLFDIDLKNKTGALGFPLTSSIDIFLLEI